MAISFFFISRDKFGSECFFVVFGDCERLVVPCCGSLHSWPSWIVSARKFFHKRVIECFTGVQI